MAVVVLSLLGLSNVHAQVPLSDVSKVVTGALHTCVLTTGGAVKCWGAYYGQLGENPATDLPSGVTAIAAGAYHTCGLTEAGGAKCWGDNDWGQIGVPSIGRKPPTDVTGLASGVTAVTAGFLHTCALTTAGGVKCWGSNNSGQLGDGSTTKPSAPVDVTGLGSGVVAIAAGSDHTCALTAAGGVKCWGSNGSGQLGNSSFTGSLTPVNVTGLASGVTAIAAGGAHTCALTAAGGMKCWGENRQGQLGTNSTAPRAFPVDVTDLVSGVAAIAPGAFHTCALTAAGAAKCWGDNSYGQLGDNSTTNRLTPANVTGLASGVTAIATSNGDVRASHTCAVTAAGGVQCWGDNSYHQLGDYSTSQRSAPVDVLTNEPAASTSSTSSTSTTTTTTTTVVSTTTTTWPTTIPFNLVPGWNLKGNSSTVPMDVAATFGDAARITTVWKWNPSASKWAFYTPALSPSALATYAQGKGYDVLTSIAPKEGFWVNASTSVTSAGSVANGALLAESDLQQGWNLVGSADYYSPSQLNHNLSSSLDAAGKAIVSTWAWDAPNSSWKFYAPALEAQGGTALADYAAGKGYQSFSAVLSASDGYWMNIGTPTPLPAIGTVMAALDSMPPSAVSPNHRRTKSISDFDAILWKIDEFKATPIEIVDTYKARVARVASEMELPVTTGFRVWQLYNHGYIVKTPTTTFAFDLVEGKGASWNSPAWNVELPNAILDKIGILFISHEHPDHYDDTERIPAYIKAHGGEVVYPKLGAAKSTPTLPMSPNDSALLKDIRVNAYASRHSVPTLIYEVLTADGYKIVHSGDTQISSVLPPFNNVHVLLLNGWINEDGYSGNLQGMKRALARTKPDVMIPGHLEELAHPRAGPNGRWLPDNRYRYTNALLLQDDLNERSRTVVLTWGERLDYTEPVCVAPLVRHYHECIDLARADLVNVSFPIDLSHEFSANGYNPSGLTGDGESLWVSNYAQGSGFNVIVKYNRSTGQVQGSIPSPSQWTKNLCFDGSDIWLTDYVGGVGKIFRISKTDGAVLASFPAILSSSAHQAGGLAWDGSNLYYAESVINPNTGELGSRIYKIDPTSGSSLGIVYETSAYVIDGLAFRNGSLWFVSSFNSTALNTNKLVNISLAGSVLSVKDLPRSSGHGLTAGADYLLFIAYDGIVGLVP